MLNFRGIPAIKSQPVLVELHENSSPRNSLSSRYSHQTFGELCCAQSLEWFGAVDLGVGLAGFPPRFQWPLGLYYPPTPPENERNPPETTFQKEKSSSNHYFYREHVSFQECIYKRSQACPSFSSICTVVLRFHGRWFGGSFFKNLLQMVRPHGDESESRK